MLHKNEIKEKLRYLDERSIPVPWSGCSMWIAGLDKDGYGQASLRNKNIRAHRLSYLVNKGSIPEGMVVMHSCDVPCCINPDHLSIGSSYQNTRDKIEKGRNRVSSGNEHYMRKTPGMRAGDKCPTAKLSSSDVEEIKRLMASGTAQTKIAEKYGVSRTCISAISTGRNWKH